MFPSPRPTDIAFPLRVFAVLCIAIGLAEALKQLAFGNELSLWLSHLVTILATASIGTAVAGLVRRRAYAREQRALAIEKRTADFTRTLLDSIPVAVFFKDRQGRYLGCNKLFTEIMGVDEVSIRGKTVSELWPSELAKTYHEKDLELMADPKVQQYEFKVVDKHGRQRDVIYGKAVFRNERNEVAGIIGTFFDITQKKRIELELAQYRGHLEALVERKTAELRSINEELKAARNAAEAASQAKSTFLRTMAHELRTPLNGVIGMGQALQMTGADTEQHKMAAVILDSAGQLLGLINDVLRFVDAQDGAIQVTPSACVLDDLLRAVQSQFAAAAKAKGIALTYELKGAPAETVSLDADLVCNVLAILVKNALEFTQTGGVRLEGGLIDRNRLWIAVHDTGCGMTEDVLAGLFEPFYQADGSRTRAHGGLGLGLALAKKFLAAMGGEIQVTSVPARGSSFRVELPLSSRG